MHALMMNTPLTLDALLRHTERVHGSREIVSALANGAMHRYRYRDCLGRARRLAEVLRTLGALDGDRIATFAWSDHRHLEVMYGTAASGLVVHPLNIRLHDDDLAFIARDGGARIALVDARLWDRFASFALAGEEPLFEQVIVMGSDAGRPAGTLDYETLLAAANETQFPEITDEQRACSLCYTSGTTGRPKGVLYSHRSMVLHSLLCVMPDQYCLASADVVLPVVPFFHANAWGLPWSAALAGAKLVLPGANPDAATLLPLIEREGVTLGAGVATVWRDLLALLESRGVHGDIGALKRIIVGGSAVPAPMIRAFEERHGVAVRQGWGMTEMSPCGSFTSDMPDTQARSLEERVAWRATQGVPVPFVDVRLCNENGFSAWDGETMGELEVRGPWVASAYHGHVSDDAFTDDGWLRTGDIATIDEGARVRIRDRSKDLVKSGGEWISSVALELRLAEHPDVAECAVIAMPDERWGERPLALVVASQPDVPPSVASLRAWLAGAFARWWIPDRFELVDALPRTATGKVRKAELRARYGEPRLSPAVAGVQQR